MVQWNSHAHDNTQEATSSAAHMAYTHPAETASPPHEAKLRSRYDS